MERRVAGFFGMVMLGLLICILSVYTLSLGESLAETAQRQSSYRLTVNETRGTIYDCNLLALTGEQERWVAAVAPGVQTASDLSRAMGSEGVAEISSLLQNGTPFALSLPSNVSGDGILTFQIPERYGDSQLAVHAIGYLDGSGHGVAGMEKAYDTFLSEQKGEISVLYQVDALHRALAGETPTVTDTTYLGKGGLVLTLDKRIQELAEQAAEKSLTKGAVLVAEVPSCKIRAMVSLPTFDPNEVAQLLEDEDSPLMNRCLAPYSVGSVFKLVSAAAALESGLTPDVSYECTGSITVSGGDFHCYNEESHGVEDMQSAIANSCNTYFVHLMQQVDPSLFLNMAKRFGFGSGTQLAPGYVSSSGILPSESSLRVPQALANFSFGQGELTATPLQILGMVNAIASDGEYTAPSLVQGTVDASLQTVSGVEEQEPTRVLSAYHAALLQNFMRASVEDGTSTKYSPAHGGAGAKTATAQTGRFDENGVEQVHSWFAGFYPYDDPQYVIVVFSETGTGGGPTCGPVFQEIADGLWELFLSP
ncbi:MAG TPA: penicillin-binding protein 2 [Candidatus Caccousia avicola]|uniref:Penicillin-binding protein 2 n=1 Tax=Candidatus Caccousia avicola TaxID=2840721 RepID=A0A9D1ALC9_9FIRM|nr:penicillin-binding protein 2 [Candidatus Caccousia avicola]